MPSQRDEPVRRDGSARIKDRARTVIFLLFCLLTLTGYVRQGFGSFYGDVLIVAVLAAATSVRVVQIRRSGKTVRQAWADDRTARRAEVALRADARRQAALLPWLGSKSVDPAGQPGVLIAPEASSLAGYGAYNVVLESRGPTPIQVIAKVRALTRLPLKTAKDLVEGAPAVVLRLPDQQMAHAAKTILEAAGGTVSITRPVAESAGR